MLDFCRSISLIDWVKPFRTRGSGFYLGAALVCLLSSLTFLLRYWEPSNLFWDENYHIASAYKYLNGTFFLEQHPPLGKLLIALGEFIFGFNKNLDTSLFLEVDHIKTIPKGFRFEGLRFIPALCGSLSALLLFLLLYEICGQTLLSFFGASFLFLDNAMVAHFRGAMLEPIQIAFSLCFILYFFIGLRNQNKSWLSWSAWGILFGLALSIKYTSAILLIFYPARAILEYSKDTRLLPHLAKTLLSLTFATSTLIGCFWIHFTIADTSIKDRFYGIEQSSQRLIEEKDKSLRSFGILLGDSFRFISRFNKGVPRLRPDGDGENGTHPIFWPVGKKSISYRWDKTNDGKVRYLRLQCNPVAWVIGLGAFLIGCALVLAKRIFSLSLEREQFGYYGAVELFCTLYFCYMLTMLNMGRVMYLYHYFVPLVFSFCIAISMFGFFFHKEYRDKNPKILGGLTALIASQAICFLYFSPLSYHLPLSASEFAERAWLPIWRYELVIW